MGKNQGISLNVELLKIIDNKRKGKGYQSRADFIREAIREKIERLGGK